jgi:dTMP kinase
MPKRWFESPPPGLDPNDLDGTLIVVEGPDAVGRSEQIKLLTRWLEQQGYAVDEVGLSRSELVGPELQEAKKGNAWRPRTMALFYATDFYDQLENRIIPSLRAGRVVLADRYVFSLMARATVRGLEPEWIAGLYTRAIVPDAVFCLLASPQRQVERMLARHGSLDFWESGMDVAFAPDMFDSFMRYQRRMKEEFVRLQSVYGFDIINANRGVNTIHRDIKARVQRILDSLPPPVDPDASTNGGSVTTAPVARPVKEKSA